MRRWSVAQGFDTMDQAAAAGGHVDVISICSPTASHHQDVLAAVRMAPRLVFCEKPVTASAARTRELIDRCAEAGVLLAVNYTRRWDPDVARLADELRTGVWGAIRSVAATYNKGVLNNGSHMIDLLHLLLGRLELCHAEPPIHDMLVLTARDAVPERIRGLDLGADDYVIKPVDLHELGARLRALVRRANGQSQDALRCGDVELEPAARQVRLQGEVVALSTREFDLLHALMLGAGRVLSREQLEQQLYSWGYEVDSNAIEVHIHHLRRKLGADIIQTVRGIGYTMARSQQAP